MKLYTGCVENRQDPLKLGRCQVRVVGLHNHDKTQLKTENLPWAYPMQPITSAGISGLGHSPVGPVEGTWVVIMFRDEDEQQPIILGTVGGIPQADGSIDQEDDTMILKADGFLAPANQVTTTTATGNVVTNVASEPIPESTGLSTASSYSISPDAIALIKKWEGKKLTSYQDSVGIWTIGYGTININGSPVRPGMTITDAQAEQYLTDHLNSQTAPIIKSRAKAPITQSMFDAMCCFTYNVGSGAYSKSTLLKELNSTQYMNSATEFLAWNKAGGKVLKGLTNRRNDEKTLFLKDGIPNVSGELSPPIVPRPPVGEVAPATSAPSNGLANNGAAVVLGFKDPKGKYPLYINEPDTNKLARHEDIKKTVVYKKEQIREKNILTANSVKWNQSPIPYNSQYPFNHVYMSESGHIMEFDDTPNSERIHLYHKSGTFSEIDANGTQVNRIIGDKYEILERNGYVYIKGTANVTIDGDHNVKINNAMNVEVIGNVNMKVNGNMDVDVAGQYNLKAKGINIETHTSPVNILSANSLNVQSSAAQNFLAGGTFNVDASRVDMNSGTAGSASGSGLDTLEFQTPELPEFTDLVVLTRGAEAAAHYETPEEGDPKEYLAKQISDGTLAADEVNSGTEQAVVAAPANKVVPLPASCSTLSSIEKWTADLQLSPHFNLGALTANGSRMPVDQQGLTAAEIVCNLKGLAENCLEPVIKLYPNLIISSGFRRPGDVAKSSKTSQHYLGEAADIIIPGFNRAKMYEAVQIIQDLIPYDQLILEYSGGSTCWIHISFKYNGPRKMAFTMRDHSRFGSIGTFTLIA